MHIEKVYGKQLDSLKEKIVKRDEKIVQLEKRAVNTTTLLNKLAKYITVTKDSNTNAPIIQI